MYREKENDERILFKKYSYELLAEIYTRRKVRFRDLRKACPLDKVRSQRLKEFERLGLIKRDIEIAKGIPIIWYSITGKGEKVVKILYELKRILKKEK